MHTHMPALLVAIRTIKLSWLQLGDGNACGLCPLKERVCMAGRRGVLLYAALRVERRVNVRSAAPCAASDAS